MSTPVAMAESHKGSWVHVVAGLCAVVATAVAAILIATYPSLSSPATLFLGILFALSLATFGLCVVRSRSRARTLLLSGFAFLNAGAVLIAFTIRGELSLPPWAHAIGALIIAAGIFEFIRARRNA